MFAYTNTFYIFIRKADKKNLFRRYGGVVEAGIWLAAAFGDTLDFNGIIFNSLSEHGLKEQINETKLRIPTQKVTS